MTVTSRLKQWDSQFSESSLQTALETTGIQATAVEYGTMFPVAAPTEQVAALEIMIMQIMQMTLLLERKTDSLTKLIQERPFVTYLTSLGDDELKVTNPIPVTIRVEDDEFIASFLDANIGTGGLTLQAAISNLQSLIADFFRDLEDEPIENLGPMMKQQRIVLMDVICRNSPKPMRKKPPRSSRKKVSADQARSRRKSVQAETIGS